MKQLITIITLFTLFLGSFSARAELLIYKGTEKFINTSLNNGAPDTQKLVVIVDHDTGYFGRVFYGTINGAKEMSFGLHTNVHIVPIVSVNGKSYTAITFIPTDCQAQTSPGNEGIALQGLNAQLKVSATNSVTFPKSMVEYAEGVTHNSAGTPILDQYRRTITFSPVQTIASNTAGETLEAAFARIVTEVRAMGY